MFYQQAPIKISPLADVVKPGTPGWALACVTPSVTSEAMGAQALIGLGWFLGGACPAIWAASSGTSLGFGIAAFFVLAPTAVFIELARRFRHNFLVRGMSADVRYGDAPITGDGLAMLEDIHHRFSYARRLIGEVPTGIEWGSVKDDVAEVIWDAAGHAAKVSALDVELRDMAYAEPGTPQGALKRQLEERRAEHWQILRDEQREADDLARQAGNAAAAAKVALARTGSIHALEVAAPSPKAAMARRSLAEVRARLALLADVWAELDESTLLLSEKLGMDGTDPQADRRAGGSS